MRYFKKSSPNQKIYLSNGAQLAFERIDESTAVYPPDGRGISEWLMGELQACINGQRGGIEEISVTEYRALIEKKKREPWKPSWREEFSKQGLAQAVATAKAINQNGGLAVAEVKTEIPIQPVPTNQIATGRPTASPPKES